MIFCGGSATSASTLKNALNIFSDLLGLHPNSSKSTIFSGGNDANYRTQMLGTFGFPEASIPVQYLGVTLLTTSDGKILVEKVVGKI